MQNNYSEFIKTKFSNGDMELFPTHPMIRNWRFEEGEESELMLVTTMAEVAEKNGMSANDLQHIFPAVLRMLKSDIPWSK